MKDNQAKYPQLRFKGFTDPWEQRKLGNFTKLITKGTTPKDKSGKGTINFVKVENLSNGKIIPLLKVLQSEHDGYLKRSKLEADDILFSIAGTLGRTAIVKKDILPANTNQALAIIRGYDFDSNFLITFLNGHVVAEYIRKNPTVGAQPNLSLEQVGNLRIETPNDLEQQKIGTFFQQLDHLIALHQRKLAKLKELKQGYLQKMFPKNGSKFPQLRFAGFADAWEQRKLGESCRIGDIDHRMPKSVTEGVPYLMTGDFIGENKLNFENTKLVSIEDYDQLSKKIKPEYGDILFARYASVGAVRYVDIQRKFLISYSCAIMKPNIDIKGLFLYQANSIINPNRN